MKKDFYIKILEFGHINSEGFTYNQLINKEKFLPNELAIIDKYFRNACTNPHTTDAGKPPRETPLFLIDGLKQDLNYKNNETKFILTMEAKFKYIDFLELKEAMISSSTAKKIAIISIVLSIIASTISIYYNIVEIKTPVKIEESQYKTLENINNKIDSLMINSKEISIKIHK